MSDHFGRLDKIFQGEIEKPVTEDGLFSESEVGLANRNHGLILETMKHDVTPAGAHYLLTHFDVPILDETSHRLELRGAFGYPISFTMEDIRAMPRTSMPVVLECSGNGRRKLSPRNLSMPWGYEAAGCAEWTGTALWPLIDAAEPQKDVVDISFTGADEGFDGGVRHAFGRSISLDELRALEVMLVYEMNGAPLLPQHGAPLRIIVPGWYGMASVKWLTTIEAHVESYQGFQQIQTYRYRQTADEEGIPVTSMKVKSLMIPPGVPDWVTRHRLVRAGEVEVLGRAWSGNGVPIESVELGVDGNWQLAETQPASSKYGWSMWRATIDVKPGEHVIESRAKDAEGHVQPQEAEWNLSCFGNNATHKVRLLAVEG